MPRKLPAAARRSGRGGLRRRARGPHPAALRRGVPGPGQGAPGPQGVRRGAQVPDPRLRGRAQLRRRARGPAARRRFALPAGRQPEPDPGRSQVPRLPEPLPDQRPRRLRPVPDRQDSGAAHGKARSGSEGGGAGAGGLRGAAASLSDQRVRRPGRAGNSSGQGQSRRARVPRRQLLPALRAAGGRRPAVRESARDLSRLQPPRQGALPSRPGLPEAGEADRIASRLRAPAQRVPAEPLRRRAAAAAGGRGLRPMRRAGLALAVALVLGACSGMAGTATETEAQELEELKARVLELQRKAAMAEVEIARLRQQVAALETRGAPAARSASSTPATPSTPSATSSRPRAAAPPAGPAAPPARRAPAPEPPRSDPEEIEESDLEDQPPPARPAPAAPSSPAGRTAEAVTAPPSRPSPGAAPQAITPQAQALYDQAYTLYHQGRYLDAEASFQRFLQSHGRTELGDNASYWIGESRYARGDLQGALAAFQEAVSRFPGGNKVPDALLKAGQCLEGLGDADGARAAYDEVLARFADSAAAAVARERRAALR